MRLDLFDLLSRINAPTKFLGELVDAGIPLGRARDLFGAMVPKSTFETLPDGRPRPVRVTIHRYLPRDQLFGSLGLVHLGRERVEGLIEQGFRDTVEHDCAANQCVLADS